MNITKSAIKNRYDLSIALEVYKAENSKGLVFIQHGLSGYMDQPHIRKMAETFYNNHYDVVIFDGTHSFGNSDGELVLFTATSHTHDLEDVIAWASNQDFYQEPFILAGHSMGSFSLLHYTEKNPDKVKAIIPTSPALSGEYLKAAGNKLNPNYSSDWQKATEVEKLSRHDVPKKGMISWNFMEDFLTYDTIPFAKNIRVPVLIITGNEDPTTPLEYTQQFYDLLETDKTLNIIRGCGHTFREPEELALLHQHLDNWIKKTL